ncbi:J domain-containing protein [Sphingomonas sp. NPDC019816]|uniref:J domain-containing protein n=1 Tax=Sphingomonas sp. NPDC019816 TaxID=3390679 RepID=UPI003CFE0B74
MLHEYGRSRLVRDPYEVLGVQIGAEPEVVDAAYRALMKKYHPDRTGAAADSARAQEINAAYSAIRSGGTVKVDVAPAWEWQPMPVDYRPPLPIARKLGFALLASAGIVAIFAFIATR